MTLPSEETAQLPGVRSPLPQRQSAAATACARLARELSEAGHLDAAWRVAFEQVPRHRFLPDVVWVWDQEAKEWLRLDRKHAQARWLAEAYRDQPVITQFDGRLDGVAGHEVTSSSSRPSVVVRALADLEVEPGMLVCEAGTGTGWNAALLAHRTGPGRVVSLEVDRAVVLAARKRLATAGLDVRVVTGDGQHGYHHPVGYDRLAFSFAVQRIDPEWLDQVTEGGIILAPWHGPWLRHGIAKLTVQDGHAEGRFLPYSTFAPDRARPITWPLTDDLDPTTGTVSETGWDPWAELTGSEAARFAVGLRLGDVAYRHAPATDQTTEAVWLASADGASWARIDRGDGATGQSRRVRQDGPRRLMDELDAAWRWWHQQSRPGPDRFGLTAQHSGHRIWLDYPDQAVASSTTRSPS